MQHPTLYADILRKRSMLDGTQYDVSHYLGGFIGKFNFKVLLEDKFSAAIF